MTSTINVIRFVLCFGRFGACIASINYTPLNLILLIHIPGLYSRYFSKCNTIKIVDLKGLRKDEMIKY